MTADIGWWGVAASTILVGVAVVVSLWRSLGLAGSILWAAARAFVQLLAVGLLLDLVLAPDASLAWAWVWVAVMVVFAAAVVQRRARDVPGLLVLTVAAFSASAVVSLGVLFGLGVFELEARTLIPITGLVIGNSMTATVVASRRVLEELRDKREEVEARLALGLSSSAAGRPYVRAALRTALIPQVESTKAVGLVFLPGAMTGLILAGIAPLDAVRVQMAVMYLILGAVATSGAIVALGTRRRLFTPDHRLVALPRPADA